MVMNKNKLSLSFFLLALNGFADYLCEPSNASELINCINKANTNRKDDIINIRNQTIIFDEHNIANDTNDGINALPSILPDNGHSLQIINGHLIRDENLSDDKAFRFFHIQQGATLLLHDITLTNGLAATGDSIGQDGGAIFNLGNLGLFQAELGHNRALRWGGGIENHFATILYIERSSFIYNDSVEAGGGLDMTGGEILQIINSTFSHNNSLEGGAISIQPGIVDVIANSTFAYNKALRFGGGLALAFLFDEDAIIKNFESNIVAKNQAPEGPDIINKLVGQEGFILSASYNLIGIDAGNNIVNNHNFNQVGTEIAPLDPKLAPLDYYGGPTLVHALFCDSTAIDRGANPYNRLYDQRGPFFSRSVGQTDIGAFEVIQIK